MKTKYGLSNAKRAKKRHGPKVQKSFRLDPEILLWLEEQGEKQGMGYQTFLNWYLNRQMSEEKTVIERLANLEAEIVKKKEPERIKFQWPISAKQARIFAAILSMKASQKCSGCTI